VISPFQSSNEIIFGYSDTDVFACCPIAEVLAFDKGDIRRESILQLLMSWKIRDLRFNKIPNFLWSSRLRRELHKKFGILFSCKSLSMELTGSLAQAREQEEIELMAKLSQAYLEWEQRTRQDGERSLILRQLTRRVGSLSTDLRSRVESLSLEQLESLGEALLDFGAIADLETWLRTYGN
jgi:Domain of unknown function (DUF4351)